MRRALWISLAVGLLSIPFLGFQLSSEETLVAQRFAGIWKPCLVGAALLAWAAALWLLRYAAPFFAAVARALSSRPALAATGLAALALPFLPQAWMQQAAGHEILSLHPFAWMTLDTLTNLWLYVVLALGLNLVVGRTGVLVLGYGGFYAAGAYTMALLAAGLPCAGRIPWLQGHLPYWHAVGLGVILGAALAALLGVLVGFPALRLRGDYLAIVTLGFGETMVLVLKNWADVTGGTNGLSITPAMLKPLKGTWAYPTPAWHYLLGLAAAALAMTFHARLNRSRLGRAFVAVREDETAARAMGIDATRVKLLAFALSASWAGAAGALFAARICFITPESFTFLESMTILMMVVLGGMGSLRGVILGAVLVTIGLEALRDVQAYRMLAFGGALVTMMILRPQGLLPERSDGGGA